VWHRLNPFYSQTMTPAAGSSLFERELLGVFQRRVTMARSLSLNRQCLGLMTRIECTVRPLGGDNGLWTLLFAAGMAGEQPSALKAQGPFHGPLAAEAVLEAIVDSLTLHGYSLVDGPQIWAVHLQRQLRTLNGQGCTRAIRYQLPEN
jgi:hypothetical protein